MLPEVFQDAAEFEAWFDFEGMVGQEGGKEKLAAMEQRDQVVLLLCVYNQCPCCVCVQNNPVACILCVSSPPCVIKPC